MTFGKLSDIENVMIDAMARAFWVSAWADRQEERGKTKGWSGNDLMDLAPATPRYAREYALWFSGGLPSLLVVLNDAARADALENETGGESSEDLDAAVVTLTEDPTYARDLGHYLAMQGMGHGVSWFDDHAKFKIQIPHVEVNL